MECARSAPTTASTKELQHQNIGKHKEIKDYLKKSTTMRDFCLALLPSDENSKLSEIEAAE